MATIETYSAAMRTRKVGQSTNHFGSAAAQEFYSSGNYVGIICFSGMNLTNKVITAISIKSVSAEAGYGAGTTKTVYVRKSKYQAASQSGITGGNYYGDALGTYTGSFYGNTKTYAITGTLFTNLKAYLEAGNNTICLFNPSPTASSQGYSTNYLQWTSCSIIVTYEEGVSQPTASASSVAMDSAVTINTNRLSSSATHTLKYSFGGASGTIATGVGASVSWTPPAALAAQIPNATSGICQITCETYYGGTLTGTKTCSITLNIPNALAPAINSFTVSEAVSGLAATFGAYVQNKSKLAVSVSASGVQGSTIAAYRIEANNAVYTTSACTTGLLTAAGTNAINVTVTDSRGRTAVQAKTVTVSAYSPPAITKFTVERCNAAGTAVQSDGTNVRICVGATATSLNGKNTMTCKVQYKLNTATAWADATTLTPSSYAVSVTNKVLDQTFGATSSYDFRAVVGDYFGTIERQSSIGTKQVLMDFYNDGTGLAFGKIAETGGIADFGIPIKASTDAVRSGSVTNLMYLGPNPSFDDTVANWSSKGLCWAFFSDRADKPTAYGFLLNIPITGGTECHQLYMAQPGGNLYHRGGNGSGWSGGWQTLVSTNQAANGNLTINSSSYVSYGMTSEHKASALQLYDAGHAILDVFDSANRTGDVRWLTLYSPGENPDNQYALMVSTYKNGVSSYDVVYHSGGPTIPISKGGTGATSIPGALTALGIRRGRVSAVAIGAGKVVTAHVGFTDWFASGVVPIVTLTPEFSGTNYEFGRVSWSVTNVTNGGFDYKVFNRSDSAWAAGTVQFHYIAVLP